MVYLSTAYRRTFIQFKPNQAIIYEIDDGKAKKSTNYNSPTANEETMNVFMI